MVWEALSDVSHDAPLHVRLVGERAERGVRRQTITYDAGAGARRAAFLLQPEAGTGPFAAALFVHWYEPESPDSNRTQFLAETERLAERGVVALLIETMWSDRDWFIKRTQADDERNTIAQVTELRRALDLLLAQPGVDARRCAYVGHDFGAMYGVLAGSIDPRPSCYV
ncbi:MAG TPA: hypothetical protein VFX76_13510, partial [Roseiflexaceae bacterium]|nr:hypothetical protein [Roseiflexaceae bacterium]